ncbi:MAG: 50S ribosomal protein L28 [Parcubacteria group bacterium CG10_big_fil_rev_8_21_14_0_10_38_31]|nr:MAG: 50S ribosomal protein L28 [Parcubacteria group bacterium CG10_big_fil_rev_8_21_14_0_10_38_31]
MTKVCPICEKGSQMGGGYSNRVRATQFNPTGKRRRYPNLQWATLLSGGRVKICTNCLKRGKHLVEKIAVKISR